MPRRKSSRPTWRRGDSSSPRPVAATRSSTNPSKRSARTLPRQSVPQDGPRARDLVDVSRNHSRRFPRDRSDGARLPDSLRLQSGPTRRLLGRRQVHAQGQQEPRRTAARRRSVWLAISLPMRPAWNCPSPNSTKQHIVAKGTEAGVTRSYFKAAQIRLKASKHRLPTRSRT